MQVSIKNFRGCASADFEVSPLALICGQNGNGKSSIAQAVAAALTGNAAVLDGLNKTNSSKLLRNGESRGRCKVATSEGEASANWPGASTKRTENAPAASAMACGLTSIADMRPKDAAAKLIEIMQADPTREDLASALEGFAPDMIAAIWARIESDGWDAAHKRAVERGQELKGGWEHVSGQKYGARKGDEWRPEGMADAPNEGWSKHIKHLQAAVELAASDQAVYEAARRRYDSNAPLIEGWRAELDAMGFGDNLPAIDDARDELEEAAINVAGDSKRIAELKALAQKGRDTLPAAGEAEQAEIDARHALEEATAKLAALPLPQVQGKHTECPHCAGHVEIISRTELKAAAEFDAAEQQRRDDAIVAQQGAVAAAQSVLDNAEADARALFAIVRAGGNAGHELLGMSTGTVSADRVAELREWCAKVGRGHWLTDKIASTSEAEPVAPAGDIDSLRDDLQSAELAAHAETCLQRAREYHERIISNQSLIDALAPTGLRQAKLSESLLALNARLEALTPYGWWTTALDDTLMPTWGDAPYVLLSESEKWRVRAVLQIALAEIEGASCIILDAADMLDKTGRNALFTMLRSISIPAIVCMTLDSREQMPNLSAAGIGQQYWVDSGELIA